MPVRWDLFIIQGVIYILKKIITFIIIFCIVFNFIFIPKKVHADFGLTLGALFGLTVGEAVLGFILSSLAVGVTYATLSEAKKAYDLNLEKVNWDDMIIRPPTDPAEPEPDGKEPKGWRDMNNKILKGLGLAGLGSAILWNLKEWYQGLGAKEGENNYSNSNKGTINGISYFKEDIIYGSNRVYEIYITVNGHRVNIYRADQTTGWEFVSANSIVNNIRKGSDGIYWFDLSIKYDYKRLSESTIYNSSTYRDFGIRLNLDNYEPDPTDYNINYFITNNSSVITDTLPTTLPQPNLSVLPKDKIDTIILPDGTKQTKYKGTEQQLIDDLVNNSTLEDIYNNSGNYEIIDTGNGLVIKDSTSTTPYPNPNPSPGEAPDVVEHITPWFQSIINWLSNIVDEIKIIPEKVTEGIKELFVPKPDYINSKVNTLQAKINTKLNLPDLTPIPGIFSGISCEPIPDGKFNGHKIYDAAYINNLASTISNWQRFLWWIIIILIGSNNGYKLIRGTDLITIKGRGGKGN